MGAIGGGAGTRQRPTGLQARRYRREPFLPNQEAYEKYGVEGAAPPPRRRSRMPNQTLSELEQRILEMTGRFPTCTYVRISGQLRLNGVGVSPSTARAVWQRRRLTLHIHHLFWLEKKTAGRSGVLIDRQIRFIQLHRRRTVDPDQQVEAPYQGYLLCQNTYFVRIIKGLGKIYVQSVVDANCPLAFAKLALSKAPMRAVHTLYGCVLPFYEESGVAVEDILTDNGKEHCVPELRHFFELFLALNRIRHRLTEVRLPDHRLLRRLPPRGKRGVLLRGLPQDPRWKPGPDPGRPGPIPDFPQSRMTPPRMSQEEKDLRQGLLRSFGFAASAGGSLS